MAEEGRGGREQHQGRGRKGPRREEGGGRTRIQEDEERLRRPFLLEEGEEEGGLPSGRPPRRPGPLPSRRQGRTLLQAGLRAPGTGLSERHEERRLALRPLHHRQERVHLLQHASASPGRRPLRLRALLLHLLPPRRRPEHRHRHRPGNQGEEDHRQAPPGHLPVRPRPPRPKELHPSDRRTGPRRHLFPQERRSDSDRLRCPPGRDGSQRIPSDRRIPPHQEGRRRQGLCRFLRRLRIGNPPGREGRGIQLFRLHPGPGQGIPQAQERTSPLPQPPHPRHLDHHHPLGNRYLLHPVARGFEDLHRHLEHRLRGDEVYGRKHGRNDSLGNVPPDVRRLGCRSHQPRKEEDPRPGPLLHRDACPGQRPLPRQDRNPDRRDDARRRSPRRRLQRRPSSPHGFLPQRLQGIQPDLDRPLPALSPAQRLPRQEHPPLLLRPKVLRRQLLREGVLLPGRSGICLRQEPGPHHRPLHLQEAGQWLPRRHALQERTGDRERRNQGKNASRGHLHVGRPYPTRGARHDSLVYGKRRSNQNHFRRQSLDCFGDCEEVQRSQRREMRLLGRTLPARGLGDRRSIHHLRTRLPGTEGCHRQGTEEPQEYGRNDRRRRQRHPGDEELGLLRGDGKRSFRGAQRRAPRPPAPPPSI